MRAPPAALWAALLLTSMTAPSTRLTGTVVVRLSFEQLTAQAEQIVHGKVERISSSWDPKKTAIWTHYEIRVEDELKGTAGGMIVVSEPGGEADGVRMQVAGAPVYEVGEEVVVFTSPTALGYHRTCGWGQGRFRVLRSAATGATVQGGQSSAAYAVLEGPEKQAPGTSLATVNGSSLSEFKALIRSSLARSQ